MLSFVMWKYSHTLYHSSVVVLYSSKWKYKHTLLNNGMLILNETWDRGISTWLYHWGSNNLPVLEEFAALCVGNLKYRKIDILASHFTYINTCHTSHFRLCVGNISRIKTQEQFPTQKVGNFRCNSVSIYMLMYIYIPLLRTISNILSTLRKVGGRRWIPSPWYVHVPILLYGDKRETCTGM